MIESSEKSSLKRKPETSKNVQSKQEMIKVKEAPPAPSTSQSNSNASANMDWEKYLELRAGQPAVDGHLFQHQHFVERTLGEHIFRPGRLVHVHHKLDGNKAEQMLKGRIQITIKNEAIIEINWMGKVKKPKMITSDNGFHFCSMEKVENEESTNNIPPTSLPYKNFFPISELELLPLEIEGTEEEKFEDAKMMSAEEWKSIDKEYSNFLANHRNWLSRPLHYFIEIGQLFELHDAKNANLVHLVRIVKCKFGMILAEFGTKNQQKEWIHICNERCHPFGWTERQNSKFAAFNHQIFPRYKLQNAFSNILPKSISMVPNWLFTFRPIQEHKFEVGMILEMLDPLNRLTFVPAFVSEICNQHYFKVRPIRNVSTVGAKNEEYLCHRCSPELLPLGWCFKNQIRLVFPEGMKGGADSNSFSYSTLRNRLKELMEKSAEEDAKISFKFAPEALFDLPKMMAKNLDCIRYCEVQNASSVSPLIYQHSPSAFLRSHRHFIWVHSESSKGPYNLPKIYSIHSLHLFRIGSANEFQNSLISAMPIKIPRELALERRHFDETYNSDESSSAILPNTKAFMPKIWMDGDLWLPKIHLNIGCFSGPFLCKTKLASLPFHFGPGPLPHLLNVPNTIKIVIFQIKTPPPLLSRKRRWIKLGAKLPIVKPKNAALLEEANKMMGIRIGEVCSNELPNSLPNEAKCSSTNANHLQPTSTIGGGGVMDRRVGTVPPNNMHPHQQPPFQFVQPANPNQHQHHFLENPPFAHSHQMILQQQMFGMGTAGGFGYPSTSSSSSPFFSHPSNQQFIAANSFQEYQQQMMAATPYFMYQMAAQQQQFGASRPMTTKYPPIMSDPTNWNCEQLAEWVGQCGQMEMANRLRNEEVDGSSFLLFNVETFRQQMRMTLGPAVKMNDLVETLKSSVSNFSSQQPGTSSTGGGQL